MLYDPNWAIPHFVSLLIALAFAWAAVMKPMLARKLYAGLFLYATLVNAAVALLAPHTYLGNARYAWLEVYRSFILGWFAAHVGLVVGAISLGQALVAAGLIRGGTWARHALIGAIVFFVAIAPLGVASAFPASLIWAFGAAWLLLHPQAREALVPALARAGRLASV